MSTLFYSSLQTSVLGWRAAFQLHLPLVGYSADFPPAFCDLGAQTSNVSGPTTGFWGKGSTWLTLGQEIAPWPMSCVGACGVTCSHIMEPALPLRGRERGKAVPPFWSVTCWPSLCSERSITNPFHLEQIIGFPAEAVMLNQHETESERPNVQGKVWSQSMSGGGVHILVAFVCEASRS